MFKKFCSVFIIFLMVFSIVNFGFSSENIQSSEDGTYTGVENLKADNNLLSADAVNSQTSSYSSHPVYICISEYVENYNPYTIRATGCTAAIINARCSGLTDSKIQEFKNAGLKVYLYVPSFYNPDTGKWDMNLDNAKNRVALYIDHVNSNSNINGIILDYVRSPGWTGYQNTVRDLVAFSRDRLGNDKSLGAFIMPEKNGDVDYGQNIDLMKPYLDEIIVMAYKGNYGTNSAWIKNIIAYFQAKTVGSNCKASGIVQSYRSDNDITRLTTDELYYDMSQVISGGGYGTGLFRAGLDSLSSNFPYDPNSNYFPNDSNKLNNVNFDGGYYLNRYSDVRNAGINPGSHYLTYGEYEGRYPNQKMDFISFNISYYWNANEDVRNVGVDPTVHYTKYGENEGRYANPTLEMDQFNASYYWNANPDLEANGWSWGATAHYMKYGKSEGRAAHA